MEKDVLIVGGGIAGLLAGRILNQAGVAFLGLEAGNSLGGRLEVGHHRILLGETLEALKEILPSAEFVEVREAPKERKKGEWVALEEDCPDGEKFYLGEAFYHGPFRETLGALVEQVGPSFRTRKIVTEVDPENHLVVCQDGSQHPYRKLIWCASLRALRSLWKGDKAGLHKAVGKLPPAQGGIALDMELKSSPFSYRNTVLFPFRFKDYRLRALGVASPREGEKALLQWIMFLEEGLLEDREEVAKAVRTLKRELHKDFPDLAELTEREKIVYLPALSSEQPVEVDSLEMVPDLFYLGPEAKLSKVEGELRNLDLTFFNYRKLAQAFKNIENITTTQP